MILTNILISPLLSERERSGYSRKVEPPKAQVHRGWICSQAAWGSATTSFPHLVRASGLTGRQGGFICKNRHRVTPRGRASSWLETRLQRGEERAPLRSRGAPCVSRPLSAGQVHPAQQFWALKLLALCYRPSRIPAILPGLEARPSQSTM